MDDMLKHCKTQHVEIEFRMGRKAATFFDTNVGEAVYTKVLRRLSRYSQWEKVETSNCEIYYGANNKRIVYNTDTEDQECTIKTKIDTIDYWDHRISIATEIPSTYTDDEKFSMTRKRFRTSFYRKGLRIDVSRVEGQANKESEDSCVYQIELEILDPATLTKSKVTNHYAKIADVLKLYA